MKITEGFDFANALLNPEIGIEKVACTKLAYAVNKNINALKAELTKHLFTPSAEFIEYQKGLNEVKIKFPPAEGQTSTPEIDKYQEEHKDVQVKYLNDRQAHEAKLKEAELMVKIHKIYIADLPLDLTALQMEALDPMLQD